MVKQWPNCQQAQKYSFINNYFLIKKYDFETYNEAYVMFAILAVKVTPTFILLRFIYFSYVEALLHYFQSVITKLL